MGSASAFPFFKSIIMNLIIPVTREQFELYKEIQREGQFNMADPKARELTMEEDASNEISKEDWRYIMKNYSMLSKLFNNK